MTSTNDVGIAGTDSDSSGRRRGRLLGGRTLRSAPCSSMAGSQSSIARSPAAWAPRTLSGTGSDCRARTPSGDGGSR